MSQCYNCGGSVNAEGGCWCEREDALHVEVERLRKLAYNLDGESYQDIYRRWGAERKELRQLLGIFATETSIVDAVKQLLMDKGVSLCGTQPCGCVYCVCEDPVQCHGCGAKFCDQHKAESEARRKA